MKKKRKNTNRKAEVRIPFPMLLANILVFVAVFGLSYVWLCARCDTLGQEINRLETVRRGARLRMINEQDRWSNLLAPANFERALKRHHLAMTLPDERQIVRVRRGGVASETVTLAYNK
ncbi:MAG: hypothetical protein JEZ10_00145 [Verrucomicrobia bacterium]|nr:hypothetical protein [Verrucomicrobiota bacterium]